MKESKSNFKIEISVEKPIIRNQKYFVYKDKKYEINFDLLVLNSTYFYKNQEKYKYVENITIITEEEAEELSIRENENIDEIIKLFL